jgi:ferredoxin
VEDTGKCVRFAGRVTVLPSALSFDVLEGETIFRAAARHGVRWPSICGGDCECGICYLVVETGAEALSERTPEESARLAIGIKSGEPRARLACRTRVHGEVMVRRRGVRPAEQEN